MALVRQSAQPQHQQAGGPLPWGESGLRPASHSHPRKGVQGECSNGTCIGQLAPRLSPMCAPQGAGLLPRPPAGHARRPSAQKHANVHRQGHTRRRPGPKALGSQRPGSPAPAPPTHTHPRLAPTHLVRVPAQPGPASAASRRPRGQGAQPHGRPGQEPPSWRALSPSPSAGVPAKRDQRRAGGRGAAASPWPPTATAPSGVRGRKQKPGERARPPCAPPSDTN